MAEIGRDREGPELRLGRVRVRVPRDVPVAVHLVAAGQVGLDLPREVGLDLQQSAAAHGEAPDRRRGVSRCLPSGELQRVGPGHRTVGADVEEVLVRQLRWAEVAEVLVHRVEVASTVVVAAELDPAVGAVVEVVEGEDPR